MAILQSKITEKGQVTIPIELRRQLGLQPNDRVGFELEDGAIRIRPLPSRVAQHFGIVPPTSRPEDWSTVRERVERAIAEDAVATMEIDLR